MYDSEATNFGDCEAVKGWVKGEGTCCISNKWAWGVLGGEKWKVGPLGGVKWSGGLRGSSLELFEGKYQK